MIMLLGTYTALSRHASSVQPLLGSYNGHGIHIFLLFPNLDGIDEQQLPPR